MPLIAEMDRSSRKSSFAEANTSETNNVTIVQPEKELKAAELKAFLRIHKLPTSGVKLVLKKRYDDFLLSQRNVQSLDTTSANSIAAISKTDDLLDQHKCQIPNIPEHFVEEALMLSCGHLICTRCKPFYVYQDYHIICKRCNTKNTHHDLKSAQKKRPAKAAERKIKTNMNEFSDDLYKKMLDAKTEITSNAAKRISKMVEKLKSIVIFFNV